MVIFVFFVSKVYPLDQTQYTVIGVMSGTSLDGIDLACVNFTVGTPWRYSFLATQTVSYSKAWQDKLAALMTASAEEIQHVNDLYTDLLAETIQGFIEHYQLESLDAVCSHGHTLFHEPEKGLTFQLGNQKKLATRLRVKVVCDFRIQDVALGGQGAPLVPIGDRFLFGAYDACLNLGGFANGSKTISKSIIAYDICAVNTVLNFLAQKKGYPYDPQGSLAAQGCLVKPFYESLEKLDFYTQRTPKSLGMEWVKTTIFPLLESYKNETVEDLLYTYTLHISNQIGAQFELKQKVLATGGGVKNTFLMKLIQRNSAAIFTIPTEDLIDFKEALIFGLLGVLRLRGEVNCLSSVTGANKDHSSGKIFY